MTRELDIKRLLLSLFDNILCDFRGASLEVVGRGLSTVRGRTVLGLVSALAPKRKVGLYSSARTVFLLSCDVLTPRPAKSYRVFIRDAMLSCLGATLILLIAIGCFLF